MTTGSPQESTAHTTIKLTDGDVLAKIEESGINQTENPPYSSFSPSHKLGLAYAASISAAFSGLSSFIYYPAITAISQSLLVSIEAVNLSITVYLVVSGIAPSIFGDLADKIGRRPISVLLMTLYFAANVGLALQKSYAALMALRCLQSAGASSTIALAYGIIADISTPAERGSYVAILMGFTNVAPALGPVLGGVLTEKISWHWIFWLLTILSGVHLLALFILLPETSRKLVGDGSQLPASLISRSVWSMIVSRQQKLTQATRPLPTFSMPNPFSCLVALYDRSNFIVIVVGGLQYAIFGCLAASLSAQMIHIYSLSYLIAGLLYLPSGVGAIIAAYFTGKLLNRDYRITAHRHNLPESRSSNNLSIFPIEQARLRSVFPFMTLSAIATAGYGWSLQSRAHIAVALAMQFITGSTSIVVFSVCGSLLTDLNPKRSATVQASYNLVRCVLSAGAVGALDAVIYAVGVGWCFTMYAIIGALGMPLFYILLRWGQDWRRTVGRNTDEQKCGRNKETQDEK